MIAVPLGTLGAPCIYASQCTTVNSRCAAGFCRCLPGYFDKQLVCGERNVIRYDTRCYFNVRKANMSQLNLPHGTDNSKV